MSVTKTCDSSSVAMSGVRTPTGGFSRRSWIDADHALVNRHPILNGWPPPGCATHSSPDLLESDLRVVNVVSQDTGDGQSRSAIFYLQNKRQCALVGKGSHYSSRSRKTQRHVEEYIALRQQ